MCIVTILILFQYYLENYIFALHATLGTERTDDDDDNKNYMKCK